MSRAGDNSARVRCACPHCSSTDLVEIAYGRREFSVTYYTDGSFEDRSGDDWDVKTWDNRCDACGRELRYDELVAEDSR